MALSSSRCNWPLTASCSFSKNSTPSVLAKSSSDCASEGLATSFTLISKLGILAREVLGLIVLGERHLDGALFARFHADELLLEPRYEAVRADHHIGVLARAAFERLAAKAALEIDDQPVAVRGGAVLCLIGPVALPKQIDLLADILFGRLRDLFLNRDALQVGKLDLGQNLERHGVFEIGGALDDALHGRLILGQLDVGLQRGPLLAVGDGFGARLAYRLLDHLGHDRAAVKLAHMRERNLARPEAVQPHLVLQVGQFRLGAGLQLACGNNYLQFTFQPV